MNAKFVSLGGRLKIPKDIDLEFKGTHPRKSTWALNVRFSKKTTSYYLLRCETHANTAITTQSWDYLVYLRDLAVHKDHLPHQRMTSQSAKQLHNYDVI